MAKWPKDQSRQADKGLESSYVDVMLQQDLTKCVWQSALFKGSRLITVIANRY